MLKYIYDQQLRISIGSFLFTKCGKLGNLFLHKKVWDIWKLTIFVQLVFKTVLFFQERFQKNTLTLYARSYVGNFAVCLTLGNTVWSTLIIIIMSSNGDHIWLELAQCPELFFGDSITLWTYPLKHATCVCVFPLISKIFTVLSDEQVASFFP